MPPHHNIKLSFKCSKRLNELRPCNSDWYCDSCKKVVHDFRGMTEAQILHVIKYEQRPCGIFEAKRIQLIPRQNKWLRLLPAAMLALGLTSCFEPVKGKMICSKPSDMHEVAPADTAQRTFTSSVMQMDAEFPGGEDAFNNYLGRHLQNPALIKGEVVVTFMIEKDGSLTDIKIVKSVEKSLDEEVVNIIKQSPHWKPAVRNGKPLRTLYTLPVDFMGDTKQDK